MYGENMDEKGLEGYGHVGLVLMGHLGWHGWRAKGPISMLYDSATHDHS